MIELKNNQLRFSFPEIHPQASLTIEFQRTLRIPDDDQAYPLPPGLGAFPLKHVDDHADGVPSQWLQRGGVMLPMFQSEAMWLNFDSAIISDCHHAYPFAIKIATGKQCAVTGASWKDGLQRRPQNYVISPTQPWLDGYVVERGFIRQFVAMPLGSGYSVEEQITGQAEHGGLQLAVYPMKRSVFDRRYPEAVPAEDTLDLFDRMCLSPPQSVLDMGLAPGGRMRQKIYDDPYSFSDWNVDVSSRCFVHLCNSMVWESVTGSQPPHPAPTARQYTKAGLPWFEYYDESATAVAGSTALAGTKSVGQLSTEKRQVVIPENEAVTPDNVVVYRKGLKPGQVREGAF
ncbi:MAG: hypothetical protein RIK87_02645 [Fuerstiella sp.]